MSINETVLEMHFLNPTLALFREKLGLGEGKFNFYKYSTQKECFVGFDQALIQTDLSDEDLFKKLRDSALNNGYNLSHFFIGIFLQYKVVKELYRRSRLTPPTVSSKPHYRVSLDTKKNANTGFSQHELLYNLNNNSGAFVYYACPMVFDKAELYNPTPDLSKLRLADISSCPSIYSDNESHFIYYDQPESLPIWCSDPVEGISITPEQMVEQIGQSIQNDNFYGQQLNLLNKLESPSQEMKEDKLLKLVGDSLIIIHFTGDDEPNNSINSD